MTEVREFRLDNRHSNDDEIRMKVLLLIEASMLTIIGYGGGDDDDDNAL